MSLNRAIRTGFRSALMAMSVVVSTATLSAEEHILFTNGFELNCLRHEVRPETGMMRIYSSGQAMENSSAPLAYLEVATASIRLIEAIEPVAVEAASQPKASSGREGVHGLLVEAGFRHHLDVDLLASLVHAESGGQVRAVSKVGAGGLMQLMPSTAASLGVKDVFRPEENVAGGTAYLDSLLTRFHDDIALALAAYNAGPSAVDRWHGIPPYRETHAYVARILNEYNRRKKTELAGGPVH